MRETAQAAMARIGVTLDPDAKVEDLSIANRQLVAICRAMAADAKLVIMDEPTASLTRARGRRSARASSRDLKREGICIVFVCHRLDEVLEVAERVTVLRDGRKVGTFDAARDERQEARAADDGQGIRTTTSRRRATRPARARRCPCAGPDASRASTRTSTFDVHAGEILGITGLLGSGRTELALSLFGMNPPDSGEIRLDGKPVALRTQPRRDRERHRLCLRGPADARPGAGTADLVEHRRDHPRQARRARSGSSTVEPRRRTVGGWIHDLAIKVSEPGEPGEDAVGRQPAARRARQMDGHRAAAADPRQPDGRRRHQRQGRHLRDRQAARRGRASPSS